MKIFYATFGCKVNSCETAALEELMKINGHESASSMEEADCIVVNSCAVTASGENRSVRALRQARRKNPGIITVLCGCAPQAFPEKYAECPDADIVTGNAGRSRLPELLDEFLGRGGRTLGVEPHTKSEIFEDLPFSSLPGHTRAFLKIEDGCDRYCAYCIIPYARGRVRSLDLGSIGRQAASLAANGYREIVLCGINLSKYGEGNGCDLSDAVAAVAKVEGIERVRLGSLEPDLLTDEMLRKMASEPKLCPQFHLALQSGCDNTLKAMNRRYNTDEYIAAKERILALFPDATFTTDVMVGFPGETEEDFRQSVEFVKKIGFLKCHVFPYSIRPGTAAAKMAGQLPKKEKERRAAVMSDAAEEKRRQVIERYVGGCYSVILEQPCEGGFTGYTPHYIPCVIPESAGKVGDIVKVRLLAPENGVCRGEIVK